MNAVVAILLYIVLYILFNYTVLLLSLIPCNGTPFIVCKTELRSTGNDLDSIRALFSEKEKELSLAVAKVESLTKQLEEIKRDRRGPLHLLQASTINNGSGSGKGQQQHNGSTAVRELDKLRKELMVSNECQVPSLYTNTNLPNACLGWMCYYPFCWSGSPCGSVGMLTECGS